MAKYDGFKSVELRRPKRSTFDLSHEKRLSTRMGKLTPVFVSETMPNDSFSCSTEVLIKLAPMIAPIFHRINLYVHFFFIPNRLLWLDWEPFITGGRIGAEIAAPPAAPKDEITDILDDNNDLLEKGTWWDYMGGIPLADAAAAAWANRTVDLMPMAALYKVWYDYYRDRNYVVDNTDLPLESGTAHYASLWVTRNRCWEHDYFTSALPFTQRGAEVLMPLSGTGTVNYSSYSSLEEQGGGVVAAGGLATLGGAAAPFTAGADPTALVVKNIDDVDFTNAEITINDLRRAVVLQQWMERNALAGSRYSESIMAHFGRKTSDSRLQRAEYLGGGKAVVQISEVMTTAYSEDGDTNVVPPGNPAGRGSAYSTTNRFHYNCEEHGFIVGFLSVMPSSAYMQGLPRMFTRRNTFLDYPWPTFAHLGEQEVYDSEIFANPTSLPADRNTAPVFGYQSRYSDWKFIHNSSHGDFRDTLDFWHLTRKFAALPTLDETFLTFEDALQDRVFNVAGVDTLWLYIYNKCKVKRSLPYFGTPMMS